MKGAIFDIDGTILDSMSAWTKATTEFYRRKGISVNEKDFSYFATVTLTESFNYIKNTYNLNMSVDEIFSEFDGIILDEYKYNIPAKPFAVEYLKKLKSDGVKLSVATSARPAFCEAAFSRLGILELFDAFCYSDKVGTNKSKPDIYLLAAEKLNLAPQECAVFEDILTGIKSAKTAGFFTCAIYDETNKNDTDEIKRIADKYILSWKALLNYNLALC